MKGSDLVDSCLANYQNKICQNGLIISGSNYQTTKGYLDNQGLKCLNDQWLASNQKTSKDDPSHYHYTLDCFKSTYFWAEEPWERVRASQMHTFKRINQGMMPFIQLLVL